MTAADRVQEAARGGHGTPGRHSAFGAAPEGRPGGRRPTAWVVAPSVCTAVLAAAAIVIVVNGAQSAGYHIKSGPMAAVWVLGGLILAVVVATLAFAGRQGGATEIQTLPESERRPAPQPMPQPQQPQQPRQPHQSQPQQAPPPPPAPRPQQAPPAMAPQVVANATEAAATLAGAAKATSPISVSDEGVDLQVIFAQLVRRLLTLVLQQINRLDELENEVEDPKLLKSLFGIDHQATQVRRYGENIGVLVGALPQRQWTHPVPVTVAQRSAVSETPDYPRVQVIPRAPGRIHGHAVSDVIHILSELVENATNYSNPTTKVTVGAHRVSAGLAIEINDHGIGMESEQFRRLNTLLRDPSGANVRDLLSQGRIGLSVVAKMAQRHGIAVELAPNVTGGTMALVVIPDALLAVEELPADKGRQPRRGVDTTQLPARPALAPLPDTLPQMSTTSAAPGSAASLSPVNASTPPPLLSPATAQVPPLPTSQGSQASQASGSQGSQGSHGLQASQASQASQMSAGDGDETVRVPPVSDWTAVPPLPTSPAAAQEAAQSGSSWNVAPPSDYSRPAAHGRPSAPAEPRWPATTPPIATSGATPVQAAPVPRPTGAGAYTPPSSAQFPGSADASSSGQHAGPGTAAAESSSGRYSGFGSAPGDPENQYPGSGSADPSSSGRYPGSGSGSTDSSSAAQYPGQSSGGTA
ncbi:sensor histidine kinase, partial [Catenulispora pinisilvae]|uniref:sensor histidine kinase n=1 Tax=Catenulispora pinisilvae TaxID=2705253 RepID=UPI001890D421